MSRIAVYPGSFDPLTNGHIDIIKRCSKIFDTIIVGIGINSKKIPMFSFEEREELILRAIDPPGLFSRDNDYIRVTKFSGLVVDFAKENNACAIIRGLRNNPDFEAEFAFAHINTRMAPEIEHVYFMASEEDHFVSSSVVKELWTFGQGYKSMVPQAVFEALEAKRR